MARFNFVRRNVGTWNWETGGGDGTTTTTTTTPPPPPPPLDRVSAVHTGSYRFPPDTTCMVCGSSGEIAGDEIVQDPRPDCLGVAHYSDLHEWLRTRRECPNCRRGLVL